MTRNLRKIGIAAVAALTFGGAIATASSEALAFKGGFGGGGFGGRGFGGFGGHGFAARGFGGGGFAARGFGGASPMFAGRSVAVHPGFATRGFAPGFAGVRPGFAGRNFVFHRGFRHRGFGVGAGLAAATLVGAAAWGYPYAYGCDPYLYDYDYPYACGGYDYVYPYW